MAFENLFALHANTITRDQSARFHWSERHQKQSQKLWTYIQTKVIFEVIPIIFAHQISKNCGQHIFEFQNRVMETH